MSTNGRNSRWLTRAFGGALAYLFAIQLVLSAAVAVQMFAPAAAGAAEAASLCASLDGSGQHGQPAAPALHGLCDVCAFTAHAPVLPAGLSTQRALRSFALVPQPALANPVRLARQHDPRSSQGPPLNA